MTYDDEKRLVKGWRGRRLLACRAVSLLDQIIENLGEDDGTSLPPDGGLPVVQRQMRVELGNQAAVLLRMILAQNDGGVSGSRLQRF